MSWRSFKLLLQSLLKVALKLNDQKLSVDLNFVGDKHGSRHQFSSIRNRETYSWRFLENCGYFTDKDLVQFVAIIFLDLLECGFSFKVRLELGDSHLLAHYIHFNFWGVFWNKIEIRTSLDDSLDLGWHEFFVQRVRKSNLELRFESNVSKRFIQVEFVEVRVHSYSYLDIGVFIESCRIAFNHFIKLLNRHFDWRVSRLGVLRAKIGWNQGFETFNRHELLHLVLIDGEIVRNQESLLFG